eukprot:SM000063S20031  [mRNA]  locus=s63:337272:337958:- [translate_table: standard]
MTGSSDGGDAAVAMPQGGPADGRMRAHAARRGIELTSISRPIQRSDFEDFDIILAMDRQNLADIETAYAVWMRRSSLPAGGLNKVKLMCSFCRTYELAEVPDPYYGGPAGFEQVRCPDGRLAAAHIIDKIN